MDIILDESIAELGPLSPWDRNITYHEMTALGRLSFWEIDVRVEEPYQPGAQAPGEGRGIRAVVKSELGPGFGWRT